VAEGLPVEEALVVMKTTIAPMAEVGDLKIMKMRTKTGMKKTTKIGRMKKTTITEMKMKIGMKKTMILKMKTRIGKMKTIMKMKTKTGMKMKRKKKTAGAQEADAVTAEALHPCHLVKEEK
jgi:hypothetical protein